MNLVVTGEYLPITADKLGTLVGVCAIANRNGKPPTQDHHLVATRHRDQKTGGLLCKSRCQFKPA